MMEVASRFLFLGTGSSMGVPVIGCDCPVCASTFRFNKRLRSSGLITIADKKILVDCGPDFREQALRYNIRELDGMLLTHSHYDHIAGLDEMRIYAYRSQRSLPTLVSNETADALMSYFSYMFPTTDAGTRLLPKIAFQRLEGERGTVNFEGLAVKYFSYDQAGMKVSGFRLGNLAYITDIYTYPQSIFNDLKGIDILIIGTLRFTRCAYCLSVDEAIDFAVRTGAKETWLTHIAHELDHEKTNSYLPPNIRVAYDGLEIDFNGELN